MKYMFTPTILDCRYFHTKNCSFSPMRTVADYEFDFYIGEEREMWIDDQFYKINNGSLVIRYPGQKVYSKGDYNCYMLTLDFSNSIEKSNYTRNNATKLQPLNSSHLWETLPSVFSPFHYDDFVRIYKKIISINTIDINDDPASLKLVNELLCLIMTDYFRYNTIEETNNQKDCIDDVCNFIKLHYSEEISLEKLSDITHLNKNHLVRKFKKKLQISPIAFLIQYRLDMAKRMLSQTDTPIKSIAFQCGFNDYSYFCLSFKKRFSITPATYRANKMLTK